MTEKSYFWNGVIKGDATEAPYSSNEYAKVMDMLYGASGILGTGEVFAEYGVNATAGMTVQVLTGYSVIKGKLFNHTPATTLTLDAAHATLNRWDRIVIRVDYATKTIAPAVITGTVAAVPSVPACTQIENVRWEMPLAKIFVPAAAIATSASYIHDEREYVLIPYLMNSYSFRNLLNNCEFINVIPGNIDWTYSGTAASQDATMPHMSRGRTVHLSASSTLSSIVPRAHTKTNTVTLRGRVEVLTGSGYVSLTPVQFGTGLGTVLTKSFPHPGVYEFTVRSLLNSANSHGLRVLFGTDASSSMDVGQCVLGEGPIAPPFGPYHEILFNIVDPGDSYNYTNVSSGNYDILRSQLPIKQSPHETGIRALIFRIGINDSGSAAAASVFTGFKALNKTSYVLLDRVGNVVNDKYRETIGFVPLDIDTTSALQIGITASGAGTADVEANLIGMAV